MKNKLICSILIVTMFCFNTQTVLYALNEREYAESIKNIENISINRQSFPDDKFRDYISTNYDKNHDDNLDIEEIKSIDSIYIQFKQIDSLKGIELLPYVKYLYADHNRLSDLDLSSNHALEYVQVANNGLKSIQLPNKERNNTLHYLDVFANALTELDTDNLFALNFIHCDDNYIETLDFSDNPLKDGHGFVAMHNRLKSITLPNNGNEYPFAEFLAEQQENDGFKTYWFYDRLMTNEITTENIILNGQTLYADYRGVPYYLTFNPGKDASGYMEDLEVRYNEEFRLPQNLFVPDSPEKQFAGWKDKKGRIYQENEKVKNLSDRENEKVELTAVWKDVDYTGQTYQVLLHDTRNGKETIEIQEMKFGEKGRISIPTFAQNQKNEYLIGWATELGGSIAYRLDDILFFSNPDELDNGVLNLYAIWQKNHIPHIMARDRLLTVGDEFNSEIAMKDVTAYDEEDGDLTSVIEIIENTVDTSKTGKYHVTYKVTDSQGASSTKTIAVTVLPKTTPINRIPVITATDKIFTVGDEFNNEITLKGVTAYDEEDGDVTESLEVLEHNVDTSTAGTYYITYKATDSQGAFSTKTVNVFVYLILTDINNIPVIDVEDKEINVGDTFDLRKDVTASDKEDGDLTDVIEIIENTVDTSKAGIYHVTYEVTDKDGASSVKTIRVVVKDKEVIPEPVPEEPKKPEYKPEVPQNPEQSERPSERLEAGTPETGDRSDILVWSSLTALAGVILGVISIRRKRKD